MDEKRTRLVLASKKGCLTASCHGQKTYQGVLVPGDALLLVGVGVSVAVDRAGLAAEKAVQGRADLVAAGSVDGVALLAASLEQLSAVLSVAWRRKEGNVST